MPQCLPGSTHLDSSLADSFPLILRGSFLGCGVPLQQLCLQHTPIRVITLLCEKYGFSGSMIQRQQLCLPVLSVRDQTVSRGSFLGCSVPLQQLCLQHTPIRVITLLCEKYGFSGSMIQRQQLCLPVLSVRDQTVSRGSFLGCSVPLQQLRLFTRIGVNDVGCIMVLKEDPSGRL